MTSRPPYRVGLTGGIGSGKTTVANLFSEFGTPVLSADQLARELVQPGSQILSEIVKLFGGDMLTHDQELNRSKLRELVFDDEKARNRLEKLLHPAIRRGIDLQCQKLRAPYVIIEIPLLVESGQGDLVDRVLVVQAPEYSRISRVEQRDGLDRPTILAIMQAQSNDRQRVAAADDIIVNTTDIEDLRQKVGTLHLKYLSL